MAFFKIHYRPDASVVEDGAHAERMEAHGEWLVLFDDEGRAVHALSSRAVESVRLDD